MATRCDQPLRKRICKGPCKMNDAASSIKNVYDGIINENISLSSRFKEMKNHMSKESNL